MLKDIRTKIEELPIEVKWKNKTKNKQPKIQESEKEGWRVYIKGEKLSQMNINEIYHKIMEETAMKKWAKYTKLEMEDIKSINWNICGRAFRKLMFSKQKQVTKHLADQFATGTTMVKWKFKEKDNYPRCNLPGEDREHILICKDKRTEEQFKKFTDNVTTWMETVSTDPEIIKAINQCLKNIREPTRVQLVGSKRKVKEAYQHQKKLGFNNMTLGIVSPK